MHPERNFIHVHFQMYKSVNLEVSIFVRVRWPAETSARFPLSYCFFRPSFTGTFFSPELLLPKNDQLKGISQHIHLSSAVLSSSAKNDKPIDFKFLLIRINPQSWNLKWNSSGPWKRTWQLQSCDYSLIFSPLNLLSWLKNFILKSL